MHATSYHDLHIVLRHIPYPSHPLFRPSKARTYRDRTVAVVRLPPSHLPACLPRGLDQQSWVKLVDVRRGVDQSGSLLVARLGNR